MWPTQTIFPMDVGQSLPMSLGFQLHGSNSECCRWTFRMVSQFYGRQFPIPLINPSLLHYIWGFYFFLPPVFPPVTSRNPKGWVFPWLFFFQGDDPIQCHSVGRGDWYRSQAKSKWHARVVWNRRPDSGRLFFLGGRGGGKGKTAGHSFLVGRWKTRLFTHMSSPKHQKK